MRAFFLLISLVISLAGSLDTDLKEHIHDLEDNKTTIGWIDVPKDSQINQSTFINIKLSLEDFVKNKASFIILNLDTPGGEVFSAMKISKLLKEFDQNHSIPIVAYINDWAISAGALLAYSCRYIAVMPTSSMGAAAPITVGSSGQMEMAPEKIKSALRSEFANVAVYYGRNPFIAEAMVDDDIILIEDNGVIKKGEPDDKNVILQKGKLLTLNASQLMDYGVADFKVVPNKSNIVTAKEKKQGFWPGEKSAVLSQSYLKTLPNPEIITYSNWRITFFSILSSPVVSSILMMGLVLGFYLEASSSGFGVMGSIAVGCLALILLNSFAVQSIQFLELIFLVSGIVLLLVEVLFIPGFGVIGVIGGILALIGLGLLIIPGLSGVEFFKEGFGPIEIDYLLYRLVYFAGALILSVILLLILARLFKRKIFEHSPLILKSEQNVSEGYVASIDKMPLVDDEGFTESRHNPSGISYINGIRFHTTSYDGCLIDKGVPIHVKEIKGNKILIDVKK